jgi:hypothetical protein
MWWTCNPPSGHSVIGVVELDLAAEDQSIAKTAVDDNMRQALSPFLGAPWGLVEALVVSLDADPAGISSRDENEIRGRQCESNRPPDRCVGQRLGTGGDIVNGERIFGR